MLRYQTWCIRRWSWQISFDRYSNDRWTITVTAFSRTTQGVQFLNFWEHLLYISSRFCILSPGWSDCTLWPSVGCIWLGSRRCWAASILDPAVKKAHNTQNLLCHWPRTLSKRFSICCDWPGRDYNTRFYATRSISWCFYRPTNHVQSTSKKHLCNVSRGKSWVRVGSTDLRDAPNNCHRQIN